MLYILQEGLEEWYKLGVYTVSYYTLTTCCILQEGLEEWYKLGIRPDDVIQALSALTIQDPLRIRSEEPCATLSPITEERPTFPERESGSFGTGERERDGDAESVQPGFPERESGSLGTGERERDGDAESVQPGFPERESGSFGMGERERDGDAESVQPGFPERESGSFGMGECQSGSLGMAEPERDRDADFTVREGEKERNLTWDDEDVTEISFARNHSTNKGATSSVISMATATTSVETEGESCAVSSSDVNDSDSSVFSPEPSSNTLTNPAATTASSSSSQRHRVDSTPFPDSRMRSFPETIAEETCTSCREHSEGVSTATSSGGHFEGVSTATQQLDESLVECECCATSLATSFNGGRATNSCVFGEHGENRGTIDSGACEHGVRVGERRCAKCDVSEGGSVREQTQEQR